MIDNVQKHKENLDCFSEGKYEEENCTWQTKNRKKIIPYIT
jgi:hypothetical protein